MLWIIVNPVAGKGNGVRFIPRIESRLKAEGLAYQLYQSEYQGHCTKLAHQAVEAGAEAVIAAGGDGTLLEVTAAMVGTGIPLGIIPCGTGNDFVKTVGIEIMNLESALDIILKGEKLTVDIGDASGEMFLNVAGMGFDADVVANTAKYKKIGLSGMMAYGMGVINTVFAAKNKKMILSCQGVTREVNVFLVAVANGRMIGGGMAVAPHAKVDDGVFDVCVTHDVPRHKILALLPKFIKGTHIGLTKYVEYFKADSISITCPGGCNAQIDGNLRRGERYDFTMKKGALQLFASK